MDKITFQKFFSTIYRNVTNEVLRKSVFGKTLLALLVFILSANGIPDWQKNQGKNFKSWTWEVIKETVQIPLPPPFGPDIPPPTDNWYQRAGLQALNHRGEFYIFGGRTPLPIPVPGASIIHGDVWKSSDKGKTWQNLLQSNPTIPGVPPDPNSTSHWANRAYFQAVKKGRYMYIIGGQDFNIVENPDYRPDLNPEFPCGIFVPPEFCFPQKPLSQFFNDVWRSMDGINWQRMVQNQEIDPKEENPAHWAGRAGLSATVFKGYIYVMGGSVNDDLSIDPTAPARIYFNDVWRSRNGRNWEKVNNAPWAPRAGGIAVVKGGYMYMIGGEEGFTCAPQGVPSDIPCPPYFNDVWRTKDGINWEEMTPEAEWDKRPGHQVVVAQDRLVLFGGFGLGEDNGATPSNPSDVWISNKGKVWKKVSDAPWNADGSEDIKYDFDAVVVKGKNRNQDAIYTFGGDRETFDFNDDQNYKNVDNDVWKFSLPKKSEEETEVAKALTLYPNYPNPFNESTTLKYYIPSKSYVSLMIFDRYGRYVTKLVNKNQGPGEYEVLWNGENYRGKSVRNGLYYARIWHKGKARTIKMIKN
ncbi:T9SS type A sorting domain-containing protein [Lutimonas saemankumensis]|uniref:T9SS type A sorting domain-containing protein n=1 Tax=Lutimonas saemankumensis TaxID=483016 RepID=UPI001CD26712|nr:T9SS type A sorting domain-containing protein [Lutimonas saemankumensis]MCA0931919.1 T9SS type A sorting domain-containing protein [Lutimonas saemankumensis]